MRGGAEFGDEHEHYAAGAEVAPHSLWLRRTYMSAILPRWGGSYRQMKRFADECQEIASVQPQVRSFFGWMPWDQATVSEDMEECIQLCTTAPSYSEDPRFLRTRGHAYLRPDRYQEALADYNRAVELWPLDVAVRARQAELHAYLGRLQEARADLAFLERLSPTDSDSERARSYISTFRKAEGRPEGE